MNYKSITEFLRKRNIKTLLLIFLIVIIAATPLTFVSIFAHEGSHGLLVVPAIILNREIPEMSNMEGETSGTENHEWNPFTNFPAGIFLFFLSFPLGVIANGIVSYLSYKNAKLYRISPENRDIILLAIFLSFCIMNFKNVLGNFFGEDFAFIWEGIGFSYDADWFRYFIKIVAYVVFPLFLGVKKGFDIGETLTVSVGTYAGSTLAKMFIFEPLLGMLMANFWWLFIVGLPVFITAVVVLWLGCSVKEGKMIEHEFLGPCKKRGINQSLSFFLVFVLYRKA
jgi:hypothetical protein